jgi:hypothetical protein
MTTTFGATSTTDDVLTGVNLRGKRILVTGVSAGLGVETARALTAHDSWRNVYAGEREVRPPLTRQQGLEALPVGSLRHEPKNSNEGLRWHFAS